MNKIPDFNCFWSKSVDGFIAVYPQTEAARAASVDQFPAGTLIGNCANFLVAKKDYVEWRTAARAAGLTVINP